MTEQTDQGRPCIVCGRRPLAEDELQTHVHCINTIRRQTITIVDLYALLSAAIMTRAGAAPPLDPTGIRGDNDHIPGGDALVMLAGGSGRWHYDDRTEVDSVVGNLARWEDDWREHFGLGASRVKATLTGVTGFLLDNLARAAQWHPAFDEFATDVHVHHAAITRLTGHGDPTERGAPCPYCGRRIIRRYIDPDPCDPECEHTGDGHDQGGRRDEWVCSNRECRYVFDDDQHRMAVWQAWQLKRSG
ncbi:hypothetical protein [Haloactinopolyspora alba]|uniref:hypothetical protein n=1 Tax=Haloactinopolyspora alba TaxID=648780 RepID=UPI00101C12EA|nr:hypothetical protein [Haloactinopolyspora alba]